MLARVEVTRQIAGMADRVLNRSVIGPVGADGEEADVDMTVTRMSGFRRYGFEGSAMLLYDDFCLEDERCEFRGGVSALSGTAEDDTVWYRYNGRVLVFNDDREDGHPGVAMTLMTQGEMNDAGHLRSTADPIPPRVVQPNDQQVETMDDLSARATSLIIIAVRIVLWQQWVP